MFRRDTDLSKLRCRGREHASHAKAEKDHGSFLPPWVGPLGMESLQRPKDFIKMPALQVYVMWRTWLLNSAYVPPPQLNNYCVGKVGIWAKNPAGW